MIAAALAAAAALLHAATATRYGYFRDELYLSRVRSIWPGDTSISPLGGARRMARGADRLQSLALRALPILAAALTAYVAVALARELGGGRFAQSLAGVATLLTPAYLLLGNTLTTTSFEPLTWTLAIYAGCRSFAEAAPSGGPLLAVTIAFAAYGKYSIILPVAGLTLGLLLTQQRRVLLSPWPLFAAGRRCSLLAPNVAWQAVHGWPIAAVLRGMPHTGRAAKRNRAGVGGPGAQYDRVRLGAADLHQRSGRADLADRYLGAVSDSAAARSALRFNRLCRRLSSSRRH